LVMTNLSESVESDDRPPELIVENDNLLALVVHELKNPITVIHGQAQLLRRRLVQLTGAERTRALDHVEAIDAAALAMLRLVDELLDATKERRG